MHATRTPRHACAALALLFVLLFSGKAFPADTLDLQLMLVPSRTQIPLSVDSDGDGIPDQWEIHGYWDNGTFVNLPAMGANPRHKDLFIWMDYMVRPDSTSMAPSQTVIDNIKAVFNNAPVQNPDGTTGIHIHPVLKNQVPYQETLGVSNDYVVVWQQFDQLKQASFNAAYAKTFRYMIWADTYNQGTSSGLARGIPAMDFIVSLGGWTEPGGTDWQKLGTFIHELGHCLSLKHGGTDHVNYKPNYLSVMNYFFQTWGQFRGGDWGDNGHPHNFDYQRIDTPALNEAHLNELVGLTGAGDVATYGTRYYYYNGSWQSAWVPNVTSYLDWNYNAVLEADISADINGDGQITVLTAQNNWPNIDYSANGLIGPASTEEKRRTAETAEMPEELRHELTLEMQQELDRSRTQAPAPTQAPAQ